MTGVAAHSAIRKCVPHAIRKIVISSSLNVVIIIKTLLAVAARISQSNNTKEQKSITWYDVWYVFNCSTNGDASYALML